MGRLRVPCRLPQVVVVSCTTRTSTKLGLTIPTTWDEFAANNEAIKEARYAPGYFRLSVTWTAQLFVLADI